MTVAIHLNRLVAEFGLTAKENKKIETTIAAGDNS